MMCGISDNSYVVSTTVLKLSREESDIAWGGNRKAVATEDQKLQCEKMGQTEKPGVKEEIEGAAAKHRRPWWNENFVYFSQGPPPPSNTLIATVSVRKGTVQVCVISNYCVAWKKHMSTETLFTREDGFMHTCVSWCIHVATYDF